MSLSKTLYPLLSTGVTQEDPSRNKCKNVELDVKNQIKCKIRSIILLAPWKIIF